MPRPARGAGRDCLSVRLGGRDGGRERFSVLFLCAWGEAMTEQLWFVLSNGREFGPLTQAELQALVSDSVIGPDAMVSADHVNWQMLPHAVAGPPQPSATKMSVGPVRPYTPPPQSPPPFPAFAAPPSYSSGSTKKPPNRAKLLIWLSSIGFLSALAPGCLGLIALPLALLAPISWWMAANELAAIRRGQLSPKGTGTIQVAIANGLLGTIVLAVWVVLVALAIAASPTPELSK